MKNMKKVLAFVLAAMLLCLSACGSFESKMAKAVVKMSKLESLHMDLEMQVGMSLSAFGQSIDMDMSMSGGIDMKTEPEQMMMDMTVATMGVEQQMLMYVEKNGEEYEASVSVDEGATWEKQTLSAEDAPGQMNVTEGLQLFADCAASFKEAGKETVLGSAATRYDGEISGENIGDAMELSGAREIFSQNMGVELDEDAFSNLGSIPASVWIDDKSGMIVRYDMDMTEIMQSIMTGVAEEIMAAAGAGEIDMDIEMKALTVSFCLSQFDNIGEIVLPGKAEAA